MYFLLFDRSLKNSFFCIFKYFTKKKKQVHRLTFAFFFIKTNILSLPILHSALFFCNSALLFFLLTFFKVLLLNLVVVHLD